MKIDAEKLLEGAMRFADEHADQIVGLAGLVILGLISKKFDMPIDLGYRPYSDRRRIDEISNTETIIPRNANEVAIEAVYEYAQRSGSDYRKNEAAERIYEIIENCDPDDGTKAFAIKALSWLCNKVHSDYYRRSITDKITEIATNY